MNDQYGRRVVPGDIVTFSGQVISVLPTENYINCTVRLSQEMPPSGMQFLLDCNTRQLTKVSAGTLPPEEPVPNEET